MSAVQRHPIMVSDGFFSGGATVVGRFDLDLCNYRPKLRRGFGTTPTSIEATEPAFRSGFRYLRPCGKYVSSGSHGLAVGEAVLTDWASGRPWSRWRLTQWAVSSCGYQSIRAQGYI